MFGSLLLVAALGSLSDAAPSHRGALIAQADDAPLMDVIDVLTPGELAHEAALLAESRPGFVPPIGMLSLVTGMLVPGIMFLAMGLQVTWEGQNPFLMGIGLGILIPAAIIAVVAVVMLIKRVVRRAEVDHLLLEIEKRQKAPPVRLTLATF